MYTYIHTYITLILLLCFFLGGLVRNRAHHRVRSLWLCQRDMYIYVFMFIYMRVCMCMFIYIYIYIYIHLFFFLYVCTHISIYTYSYIYMYRYRDIETYIYEYVYIDILIHGLTLFFVHCLRWPGQKPNTSSRAQPTDLYIKSTQA